MERLPLGVLFALQVVRLLSAWPLVYERSGAKLAGTAPAGASHEATRPVQPSSPARPIDDWSQALLSPRLDLSLAERIAPGPARAPDAAQRIRDGVARILRDADDDLGLNQPEVGVVARVVAEVARETGAVHGSKAVFSVTLGPSGSVLEVTRDLESRRNRVWANATEEIVARLGRAPVRMGAPAAGSGAVVEVAVEVLHVFPHGTDWQFKVTDCSDVPKIQHVDEHGRPFLATFPFGLRFDIGSWGADKQLVVRTRATRRVLEPDVRP